jgi:hypothetical protein
MRPSSCNKDISLSTTGTGKHLEPIALQSETVYEVPIGSLESTNYKIPTSKMVERLALLQLVTSL